MSFLQNLLNMHNSKEKDLVKQQRRRSEDAEVSRKSSRTELLLKRRNLFEKDVTESDEDELSDDIMQLRKLAEGAADFSKPEQQLLVVQQMRRFLWDNPDVPIDDLIKGNILPILVEFLGLDDNALLQFEAAWALATIAAVTSDEVHTVVATGAVPLFIDLLKSPVANFCEQFVMEQCGVSNECFLGKSFTDHGVTPPLFTFINPDVPVEVIRNVTSLLMNLCRRKDALLPYGTIREILPLLAVSLDYGDGDVTVNVMSSLGHLSDGHQDYIQLMFDGKILLHIMRRLQTTNLEELQATVHTVANLAGGTYEQLRDLLSYKPLAYIPDLIAHPVNLIRKDAVRLVGNVNAGHPSQIQDVINLGLVPRIIKCLGDVDFDVRKEAALAVSNLSKNGTRDQVFVLIQKGAISPLCKLLPCQDPLMIIGVLDALKNILDSDRTKMEKIMNAIEVSGGLLQIEELQNHEHAEISNRASYITDKCIADIADDDDFDIDPQ